MPSTPPVNPSPDTLFARTKRILGLYPVPPDSTRDPVRDILEGKTRNEATEIPQQQPQHLQLVESHIREYEETLVSNQPGRLEHTSPIVPPEKVAALLNVLQDPDALDTVLLYAVIADRYDLSAHKTIACIVRTRFSPRHSSFESSYVVTLWEILRRAAKEGKELFGAVSQLKEFENLIDGRFRDRYQGIYAEAKAILKDFFFMDFYENEAE